MCIYMCVCVQVLRRKKKEESVEEGLTASTIVYIFFPRFFFLSFFFFVMSLCGLHVCMCVHVCTHPFVAPSRSLSFFFFHRLFAFAFLFSLCVSFKVASFFLAVHQQRE